MAIGHTLLDTFAGASFVSDVWRRGGASGSATKKQLPCSHRNLYHGRVELPLLFVWDGELLPRLVLFRYLCPDPV